MSDPIPSNPVRAEAILKALEQDVREAIELAEVMERVEMAGTDKVKLEYWKGELAALRRVRSLIVEERGVTVGR